MTGAIASRNLGEACSCVCVCVGGFGLHPADYVILPAAPPAPAQRPRCVHLDAEQREAHGLRPCALQGHPVLQRGRGDRQGVWQGQDGVPQGEAPAHTEAHDRRRQTAGQHNVGVAART